MTGIRCISLFFQRVIELRDNFRLQFCEIKDIKQAKFKDASQIYIDAFPPNQRLPIEIIAQRTQENIHQFFVGLLQNRVVLMAIIHPLKNTNFSLLAYVATEKIFRGQGIGTEFIKYILNQKSLNRRHLIIEVEQPVASNQNEYQNQRINFYKKFGAKLLKNVNYILPPLQGNIFTEMQLMIMSEYPFKIIDSTRIKTLIKQIYEEVYGRSEDDHYLNLFIHKIEKIVELV